MFSHTVILSVFGCMLVAACARPAAPSDDIFESVRTCGLEGQLRLEPDGDRLLLHLAPTADYERVDCFLKEARRLRVNLGFVGNEAVAQD